MQNIITHIVGGQILCQKYALLVIGVAFAADITIDYIYRMN